MSKSQFKYEKLIELCQENSELRKKNAELTKQIIFLEKLINAIYQDLTNMR